MAAACCLSHIEKNEALSRELRETEEKHRRELHVLTERLRLQSDCRHPGAAAALCREAGDAPSDVCKQLDKIAAAAGDDMAGENQALRRNNHAAQAERLAAGAHDDALAENQLLRRHLQAEKNRSAELELQLDEVRRRNARLEDKMADEDLATFAAMEKLCQTSDVCTQTSDANKMAEVGARRPELDDDSEIKGTKVMTSQEEEEEQESEEEAEDRQQAAAAAAAASESPESDNQDWESLESEWVGGRNTILEIKLEEARVERTELQIRAADLKKTLLLLQEEWLEVRAELKRARADLREQLKKNVVLRIQNQHLRAGGGAAAAAASAVAHKFNMAANFSSMKRRGDGEKKKTTTWWSRIKRLVFSSEERKERDGAQDTPPSRASTNQEVAPPPEKGGGTNHCDSQPECLPVRGRDDHFSEPKT